ncbi:MAG: hypothetical protein ACTSPC_07095, partial [Candidatus Heimdallarchaeota archaeon]
MSNSLNQKLNAIEKLILKGRFSNALDDIEKLKKIVKKNGQEFYQLLIWENYLKIKLGDYNKAIEKLDKLIASIKKKDKSKLELEANLIKISILSEIGKYDEMLSTINFGLSSITELADSKEKELTKAHYNFQKGKYFFFKGED